MSDTGIGIERDRLDALFQPFEQLDASTARPADGTGLGLSISRTLVQELDGRLVVESEVNDASTFRLELTTGPLAATRWLSPKTAAQMQRRAVVTPETLTECLFVCVPGRRENEVVWRELGFDYFLQKPAPIDAVERLLTGGKPAALEPTYRR